MKPMRTLAWERLTWSKAQGPAIPCSRCDLSVREGVIRSGTEHLLTTNITKLHILCNECYNDVREGIE